VTGRALASAAMAAAFLARAAGVPGPLPRGAAPAPAAVPDKAARPPEPLPRAPEGSAREAAREMMRRGRTGEAIELLSEAVSKNPSDGGALSDLIQAYLTNGDLEFAELYLQQAVSTTSRVNPAASAYRSIGDAFAARQRLEGAIAAWEFAAHLGDRSPDLAAAIDRARAEMSLRGVERVRVSDRFVIHTDVAIPEDVAARIEEHLTRELDRLSVTFPSSERLAGHIAIVYEGRAYFSLVSIPTWVSGVFDGKIRVSVEAPARWSPELAAVLSHELTHAYVRAVSHGRAPAWLHEGLAQWFQGERIPLAEMKSWFAGRRVRGMEELETIMSSRPDRLTSRDLYAEALGLVEHWIDEHGPWTMACVLSDLGGGATVEEALTRETGRSPAELVARWKRAARL